MMTKLQQWLPQVPLIATLILPTLPASAAQSAPTNPRHRVAFYVEAYGKISPEQDKRVALAHSVFERVRAVADKNSIRPPHLVVIDSPGDPWAIALPDGYIVLSKKAIGICHSEAVHTEACLAFVFGHELAHLAHNDFWHQEVQSFLADKEHHGANGNLPAQLARSARMRELAADDTGFVYAAIAGYSVDSLMSGSRDQSRFFELWMNQTNTRVGPHQTSAEERGALLQKRLATILEKLAFFQFGVRLAHFDYCDDGVYFLREFFQYFPGREVTNNLGFCYLQLARQEMAPERASLYWLPKVLDIETRASFIGRRGEQPIKSLRQTANGRAEGFLQEAVSFLKQAVNSDPGYLPARLNLAIAYLYLGQPHQARAVLSEVRTNHPNNMEIKLLEALVLYEQSEADLDLWSVAVQRLQALADMPESEPQVWFNLARLLEIGPRPEEADQKWNHLARFVQQLPPSIQDIVCRKQSVSSQLKACQDKQDQRALPPSRKWPLPTSGLRLLSPRDTRKILYPWEAMEFDWFGDKLHGHIYRSPSGDAEVLELDQFVQMQVLKGKDLSRVRDLSAHCANALRTRSLHQGKLWSCDTWAALERDGEVKELWWIAK
jgi:tetratricopeptide (TPR) repeat protein